MPLLKRCLILLLLALLTACASTPAPSPAPAVGQEKAPSPTTPSAKNITTTQYECQYTLPSASSGQFYKDDGPQALPDNLSLIPDAQPTQEALHRYANSPYTVLGQNFVPLRQAGSYQGQGIASWYGRRFHGKKTASGETYDMFQMTAAHPTLPIPSYARVTNLKNQRSVIVRINDRGPFLKGREIDLSFLAACRLGYAMDGSTQAKVESLDPADFGTASAPHSTSTVVSSATTPLVPLSTAAAPKGSYFLQFGAFNVRSNADNLYQHLDRELDDLTAKKLSIQRVGDIYRVRLGPYPNRSAALEEAERLTGKKNLTAVLSH